MDSSRFCGHCGAEQATARLVTQPDNTQPGKSGDAIARKCPFCKQNVDSQASRCPHCSGEIGRAQDCIRCPSCSELIVPTRISATNEKGAGTDLAKVVVGGGYFLSATEETYTACPVCKTPLSYCSNCQRVTVSQLTRKWVGVGRSKSGYQFKVSCSQCSGKVEGPSCFVATEVFGTTLNANLIELYYVRDAYLARSAFGRKIIRVYYRCGPGMARWCRRHPHVSKAVHRIIKSTTVILRNIRLLKVGFRFNVTTIKNPRHASGAVWRRSQ